jgi:anti-sigma regulatory factor (Ser/Thr protein kinase)
MEHRSLELTLAPEPGSVAEARARVCEALEPEVASGTVETLRLLLSEVVTNAVRHAGSTIKVHATWGSEVRVEVCDRGGGFLLAPRVGNGGERPGGFGLYLLGRLADRWGVEVADGTTVWFVLRGT